METVFGKIKQGISGWSWLKKTLMILATIGFLCSSFLFLTSWGTKLREELAGMVIITKHREWAWMAVGAKERDRMVQAMWTRAEENSKEVQELNRVVVANRTVRRGDRKLDELIKVVDIQDKDHVVPIWKGKMMYVYDPRTIKVVTTSHYQEGEKISDMVKRTGAVAGVNGGAFDDPEGLGNGFAPIGFIKSAGQLLYNQEEGSIPQQTVGFNDNGILVVGKYSLNQLEEDNVTDAVFWQPRMIANGKALPVSNTGRNPRTAVGQRRDGVVIFIVIDGRSTVSVGATEKEVQDLFMEEECDNAGFLDGGASSELVVQGELLTKPASKYGERRLPSGFLVFDHPEDYVPIRIWDNVKKIDPGGAHDHPDFQKEQADLKAKGLLNTPTPKPSASATPSATPSTTPSESVSPSATPKPSGSPASSPGTSPTANGQTPVPDKTPNASASPGASASPPAKPGGSASPSTGGGTSPAPTPTPTLSGGAATPVPSASAATQASAPAEAGSSAKPPAASASPPAANPAAGG